MRDHISVGCDSKDKERWKRMAFRMGYPNFSEFTKVVFDSMAERYDTEEWESHLVYVADNTIVGFGSPDPSTIPLATSAFQIAGPGHWWRHLGRSVRGEEEEEAPERG